MTDIPAINKARHEQKEPFMSARYLTKSYQMGDSRLVVLDGLNLDLMRGEILAIVGESGVGKSTLLHILGLLDRPTTGHIMFGSETVSALSDTEMAKFRNQKIGFIFQFHHLLPEFSALENVIMPALISGRKPHEASDRAMYLLERVGLSGRLEHRPGELSGGELQHVAVARALINEPAVVLADEPSGNLDHRNSEMLHDLMWSLAREHNCTIVVVTHDMALARQADRIHHLHDGIIEELSMEKFREHFIF